MTPACEGYARDAQRLKPLYEALDVATLYAPVAQFTPDRGAHVLDVGAGTGRDAAHWARAGCHVTAVDPVPALWAQADLTCLEDSLPGLLSVPHRSTGYDVITAIGVLHHLTPPAQITSLQRFAELLAPTGRVLLSLRHGPTPATRPGFEIDASALETAGHDFGLETLLRRDTPSLQAENISAGVTWTWLVMGRG